MNLIKAFIFIFLILEFALCGIWFSYNITAKYDINYSSGYNSFGNYDTGAITIGYEDLISKSINVGISYDFIAMKDNFSDQGASFFNLYGKYNFPPTKFLTIWTALGYHIPNRDLGDYDRGLSYGIGLKINTGFGFSYMVYDLSQNASNNYPASGGTITRYSLSYSF